MFGIRKRIPMPNHAKHAPKRPAIHTVTYLHIPWVGECHCFLLDWLMDVIKPKRWICFDGIAQTLFVQWYLAFTPIQIVEKKMYSGSLNVSSGGSNYRRRKTQRGRRPSEKPPTAAVEDPALLMPGQFGSVQYWARRFYLCLRKIVFGVSDGYDPDLEDIDLGVARYVPVSLEVLMKSTKFSRKEIQLIYCGFKQDCPTGVVSADKFRELYSQFFPLGDATVFARQIFQMMDQDMDGSVSFEEFLVVMSMLSRGSIDEKLQWVFNLYDLNGEGFLTVDSMIEIGASIYEMLGKYTDPPVHEATVREHVTRIFIKMDSNADGIVTFSEFKEFCVNDDKIRHNFCVFNSVL